MPPLYPFYCARLWPVPAEYRKETDMSIVLLQGGGLSKDQLDHIPLDRIRLPSQLVRWVATLFQHPVRRD